MYQKSIILFLTLFSLYSCNEKRESVIKSKPFQVSGIYPHLAMYNNEGSECGTGSVVPWSDRLWVLTYGASNPFGSSDKLYEINSNLKQTIRKESVGGTHANRMIHKASNQLFMGLYAIDSSRNVSVISPKDMPGRLTGNAFHLTNPDNKIYYASMEEGFYELDVNTLKPTMIYEDGFVRHSKGLDSSVIHNPLLPGAHGKGLYSGQGVLVYSLNGEANHLAEERFDIESGSLSEWNGKDWKVIRRNQFVEVTGPGGIYGNSKPETDPIWATGWDHKSVILGVRDLKNGWSFYRLPKASHSYDGSHGWNTEWPRIRNIGTIENPDYLMTMHGMFWRFPGSFTKENSKGVRPRSSYLKVIGDFTRWKDKLVFGCDDSAQKEFLNKRRVKGNVEGAGQSNSNLWFTSLDKPDQLGPNTASGAVWLEEDVRANIPSESFIFSGWPRRSAWVKNHGLASIDLTFEVDIKGNGDWKLLRVESLNPDESKRIEFSINEMGEWVRVRSSHDSKVTTQFSFTGDDVRQEAPNIMFQGITEVSKHINFGGLLYSLGDNRKALGISASIDGSPSGYYELDGAMNLISKNDPKTQKIINEKFAIPENVVIVDKSSVLIIDDKKRRWRLPMGDGKFSDFTNAAQTRICREVATERDLLNCHGTFYELPAENADGFAKIRPVSSHNYKIHDYVSYRGLLVMTGITPKEAKDNSHVILSDDKKAAVWVGAIDDLWKMGKPKGKGGPWKETSIKANEVSDPYLIGFYDKKQLTLSHDLEEDVVFTLEVDPVGHGPWMNYKKLIVKPGETFKYTFPDAFQARWIRFRSNKSCIATAWLNYE